MCCCWFVKPGITELQMLSIVWTHIEQKQPAHTTVHISVIGCMPVASWCKASGSSILRQSLSEIVSLLRDPALDASSYTVDSVSGAVPNSLSSRSAKTAVGHICIQCRVSRKLNYLRKWSPRMPPLLQTFHDLLAVSDSCCCFSAFSFMINASSLKLLKLNVVYLLFSYGSRAEILITCETIQCRSWPTAIFVSDFVKLYRSCRAVMCCHCCQSQPSEQIQGCDSLKSLK